jgi:hypothetical protein
MWDGQAFRDPAISTNRSISWQKGPLLRYSEAAKEYGSIPGLVIGENTASALPADREAFGKARGKR